MTDSNVVAQILVRAYLDGRAMDEFMFNAAVWMADKRLAGGIVPALDQTLRADIDSQAAPVWGSSRAGRRRRTSLQSRPRIG